jgi:hypothetical protein
MRFRSVASRACLRDISIPSFAAPPSRLRKKNVNPAALRRCPPRNKATKTLLSRRRFCGPKSAMRAFSVSGTRPALASARDGDGETNATAGAARVDDGTATAGLHASAKTVGPRAASFGGLVSALHDCLDAKKSRITPLQLSPCQISQIFGPKLWITLPGKVKIRPYASVRAKRPRPSFTCAAKHHQKP